MIVYFGNLVKADVKRYEISHKMHLIYINSIYLDVKQYKYLSKKQPR